MTCPEITIPNIPNDLYAKLLAEANAGGIGFNGSNRAQLHNGPISLEFDWNYDAQAEVLHVTCTRKPFIFTCDQIQERIIDLLAKAKGGI